MKKKKYEDDEEEDAKDKDKFVSKVILKMYLILGYEKMLKLEENS